MSVPSRTEPTLVNTHAAMQEFTSGKPFSDERTEELRANVDSRNWPELVRLREKALDAIAVEEAARDGKQLEPKWTEAVAFPTATEPFVLIDARGKMYRIDPMKGSYRPLWAEPVNPR